MITAIKIDEENFKAYSLVHEQEEGNKGYLDNLSKINIFIGENNSGKSRFIREVFSIQNLLIKSKHSEEVNKIIKNYNDIFLSWANKYPNGIAQRDGIENVTNELKSTLLSNINIDNFNANEITHVMRNVIDYIQRVSINSLMQNIRQEGVEIMNKVYDIHTPPLHQIKREVDSIKTNRIYIPMLRGLRTYGKDYYLERTKKDYFEEIKDIEKRIFTGLGLYEDCKNLLLGAKEDRDKIRKFEEFLSECFFDGKDVNLIPSIKDDVLHVRIGKQEFPVSQLGDGIQSIIILTYPLFFNQEKHMLFFFEEPEQCLHPAYQRVFMETLMRKEFDSFQYFFTTHSNHLLDITLEIDKVSIYTFKKTNDSMDTPTFEIENVDNENTDILRLIGVRNSSVFLSNCTIWVEGITDRIYIRKYLEVFQKTQDIKFLEDIHYSFVEYGGGNITHWSFLEDADPNHSNILVDRLCGKLFLISDQDGAGEEIDGETQKTAKAERHEKLEKKLGNRYYCLQAREIENLLDTEILKEVVKSYQPKDNDKFGFTENFTYENYKDKKIGDFIDANIIDSTRKAKYAKSSGTIKDDKVDFAKRAVKEIKSIDNLSEEAKKLSGKLYEFIKFQNKK
ncbi:hypothetical protein Fleli_3975 [Bernardetia litoralis DSM 6794]|uniref:Endonuclease GajA/Old nuclease/RecF-like AAA domain-containing protein n=1 Tax=Bernardetia litoralis (strain ATCC 23117 / DSM 6794 / NBRC 15988 / NCIMB 1366 / Fx l1 / Sio-4) TaxID=880071 RepID=I4AQP2_BERLS|nr:AAA family ATPase [Bernardetia litoralis]AFM06277.1 hypothetical protein Fleli_3975 [Bernardetia litoralis DSM 6794]